jgi:CRISPR-associated exonuclease Cas4
MTALWVLLAALVAVLVAWLAAFWYRSRAVRQLAVDHDWELVYCDTGKAKLLTAHTEDAHVVGRPDRVYRIPGTDQAVLVEDKSRPKPRFLYDSHRMQLAAYVLMVEESLGLRVTRALVQYSDGSFEVRVDDFLRNQVRQVLSEMAHVKPEHLFRNHEQRGRCVRCEYRRICPQTLAPEVS